MCTANRPQWVRSRFVSKSGATFWRVVFPSVVPPVRTKTIRTNRIREVEVDTEKK